MKYVVIIILGVLTVSCSGSSVPRASKVDIAAVKEAAQVAAEQVLEQSETTMQQEAAILRLRAKESAIRRAGFEECADTFAAEAFRILQPLLKSDTIILE